MAKPPPEHVVHFAELLDVIGGVSPRRMFGGFGFFRDGLMFALEYHGTLYLKADDQNRPNFTERDLPPFTFRSKEGRESSLSYWQAPEQALQNSAAMKPWAQSAFDCALRNQKPKRVRKKKS
jgi:DNA transformation protein